VVHTTAVITILFIMILEFLPVKQHISCFIHEIYEDFRGMKVDPSIWYFYKYGLVIGFIIVTTLAWFPGKPFGIGYGDDDNSNDKSITEEGSSSKDETATTGANTANTTTIQPNSSKRRYATTTNSVDDARSLYRGLNSMVYMIAFSVLLYYINRDYKAYLLVWFIQYFPKEARTMRFINE